MYIISPLSKLNPGSWTRPSPKLSKIWPCDPTFSGVARSGLAGDGQWTWVLRLSLSYTINKRKFCGLHTYMMFIQSYFYHYLLTISSFIIPYSQPSSNIYIFKCCTEKRAKGRLRLLMLKCTTSCCIMTLVSCMFVICQLVYCFGTGNFKTNNWFIKVSSE